MVESFLEEQLARLRKLTEALEKLTKSTAGLSEELDRRRESVKKGPLDDVRDCRVYWSPTSLEHETQSPPDDSSDHRRR